MKKLATEYAPVRIRGEVRSLFDWEPAYRQPFAQRAERMACIRVAVHPQLYPAAYQFFEENPLRELVKEVVIG